MNDPAARGADDQTAERLRTALQHEAELVETDPGALDKIQQRTRTGTSGRSWLYAGLGAAAATAAVITAVALLDDQAGPSSGPAPAASPQSPPVSDGEPSPTLTVPVLAAPVTYLGPPSNDYRLVSEMLSFEVAEDTDPAEAAVHWLLTEPPIDSDYVSGWPEAYDVEGVIRKGSTTQVDLFGQSKDISPVPDLPPGARALAVQALFRTAGGRPGSVGEVTYNGDAIDSVMGVALPVTIESDLETRAFISIPDVVDGQALDNPVGVTVSGNVFEGTVNWQLLDDSGTKLDKGFVTTSMGAWSEADIRLGVLEPGTYTLRAFEVSAEDGSLVNLDDKMFVVQ